MATTMAAHHHLSATRERGDPPVLESLKLYVGESMLLDALSRELVRFGYTRQDRVLDPGDFAIRGGIVDIFPATFESPLRLEFIGHRLETAHSFNPQTDELLDTHGMIVILPRRIHFRSTAEVPFEAFVDMEEGDWVVHVHHGIGRYRGMERLGGSRGEDHLVLEYADGDRLYVPANQLHLVQKYVGFEGRPPRVSKLGSDAWERAKARAQVGVWPYARELLQITAQRMALSGFAFPPDTDWQRAFEAAFPYRETPDQRASVEAVKRDMESPRPMDRLLLGDVGYGKTEVALRAAFKAVMAGKQVAVLAPTTILAEQHYRTFTARLASYPMHVQTLSRFRSPLEQTTVLRMLRDGACDIIIGTHRLLSDDVRFKALGLVIVDEEQRFGVRAKERLKAFRLLVDMLSLSATPIPRTLYMAMVGVKDLSLIATPPEHRHPIETAVVAYDEQQMRGWMLRELARGGQVFFIHNRVREIGRIGERLQRLVPEARIGVAHGQMDDAALAAVMQAFIDHRVDVLVSTTIVQSGIDIPNANTLIINRADRIGLADLYQLRGRVGRFDRNAWTYLVIPSGAVLTQDARQRLKAIESHTALGSGFKIAMEDLKIRGAGNLLGVEQHGHISAVGFDLYCRLLRDAVQQLKTADASRRHERLVPRPAPQHRMIAAGDPVPAARFRLRRHVAVLLLAGMLALAGVVRAEILDRIVAVVNDDVITQREVDEMAVPLFAGAAQGELLSEKEAGQAREAALRQLIDERLVVQTARKAKMQVSDQEVQERLNEVRGRFASAEEFERALAEQGLTKTQLLQRFRDQLMARKLINEQVRAKIRVGPADVEQYFAAHAQEFAMPAEVHARHILIRVNDERTDAQASALAHELYEKLRAANGADFAELAKQHSQAPEADQGGDLGWVKRGQLMPELETPLFALSVHEISPPVQTKLGYHIFLVEDRHTGGQKSLEEVRVQVEDRLYAERFKDAIDAWMEKLRKQAYIQVQ